MYFKIRKADDRVIYLTPGPQTCGKWRVTKDENGAIDEVKCFASRRQPKCRNCCLVPTIYSCGKTKSGQIAARKVTKSR